MTPREARLEGTLLGCAVGDALGLPCEGLSPQRIARRGWAKGDRFHLLGRTGFVSDDTEQIALVAQSIARFPADPAGAARAFRRSLLGWFLRLPWGIGLATLRACGRIALGLARTGVRSAGNGAAMRAAVVGVAFAEDASKRRAFGRSIAETTHLDPRGVEGAIYVAEVAAALARGLAPAAAVAEGLEQVSAPQLRDAILKACVLPPDTDPVAAAHVLGHTGFIVHTAPLATWAFVAAGGQFQGALVRVLASGGDTDSIGAIVGAWAGAREPASVPAALVARLHDGPFGPTHLRALARTLDARLAGRDEPVPRWSVVGALLRNLALFPVILAHGFARLWPR